MMGIFKFPKREVAPWIGPCDAEPIKDENDDLVNAIRASYPHGNEALGITSIVRLIVYTVFELKKRGVI